MRLNPVPTELTTAATDAALTLLCLGIAASIWRYRRSDPWKTGLWLWVLALLALASMLGAAAHGLDLPPSVRAVLWHPLYLGLGLTVALFVVGAVLDWRGPGLAHRAVPWAVLCALAFSLVTPLLGGAFLLFIGFEAVAMSGALLIYLTIFRQGRSPGSGRIAAAILLSMLAAAVQASDLAITILVPFDHNGLFHLVQMVAVAVLGSGLRAGLAGKIDTVEL
jgi:hypothetical protein